MCVEICICICLHKRFRYVCMYVCTYVYVIIPTPVLKGLIRLPQTQRVQSTYMVECRVSVLGIIIMIWGSIPP